MNKIFRGQKYTLHHAIQSDLDIVEIEIVDKLEKMDKFDIVYFSLRPILIKYSEIVENSVQKSTSQIIHYIEVRLYSIFISTISINLRLD